MKIVIGYDGSAVADGALRDLEMAGLPAKAEALVLYAQPPVTPPSAWAFEPTGTAWLAASLARTEPAPESLARARDKADHAARLLKAKFPRWSVGTETPVAMPEQAILDKAEAWKADLIVVGSHGWSWLGRTFLGSTAEKILTHAQCKVRLSNPRPETHAASPRILAAIDGSENSRLALDDIAHREWPPGVRIRLIAAKPSDPWSDALGAAEKAEPPRQAPRGSWAQMENLLDAAVARLKKAGLASEWEIQEGDPRAVILAEAEAFRADCIFLGRRGLSGLERFLLGSVSSAVASHAACSVEVVPW